jgi:hypothetical protein
MDEAEYRTLLAAELALHTTDAASRVRHIIENLPAKARSLAFEIIPDQDGEGTFSVQATLDGPDLYVLNKAIRPYAEVFGVRHTSEGIEPPVPYLDPFDVDFEVNEVLVDTVARWMQSVWQVASAPASMVPVSVTGHDGYGSITPLTLYRPTTP